MWVRKGAPKALTLAPNDWAPMLDGMFAPDRPRSSEATKRIGWVVTQGSILPPASPAAEVMVLDFDQLPGFSLDRVTMLDGIAYFPARREENLPDTLIRAALARGVPVTLPNWLKPHYGPEAHYCEPHQALGRLAGPALEGEGRPRSGRPEAARSNEARRRPIMFVASNGVGIGHLSRLLAIARRMDPRTPIVFATQAQAVGAIERLGYLAEYMPSATYVGGDFATWDDWFRYELENLLDAYDPALVVYDGNNPSDGLIRAIAPRSDCRMAWVRRGLWGDLNSPFMDNARWFDLIVEPGELEGQPDEGITARRRDEAVTVPPIRLLDEGDLLPRAEAAKALGLDPARPAALIQLGAGYNRDIVSLIDHLVGVLKKVPQLQVCIAEWANGAQALHYWPDVTYLRGYPLSQYFHAFDFSVAAAGYNTFHEVMNFDLPTIFIPNRHPSMDDQAGRAVHAQNLHVAFELDEADLGDLPDLVTLMTDTKARGFLIANGRKLHRPNGAMDAAQALASLVEVAQ
jgi:UDP:flavonoid glycosyltransferase YjiC (YdhE family)